MSVPCPGKRRVSLAGSQMSQKQTSAPTPAAIILPSGVKTNGFDEQIPRASNWWSSLPVFVDQIRTVEPKTGALAIFVPSGEKAMDRTSFSCRSRKEPSRAMGPLVGVPLPPVWICRPRAARRLRPRREHLLPRGNTKSQHRGGFLGTATWADLLVSWIVWSGSVRGQTGLCAMITLSTLASIQAAHAIIATAARQVGQPHRCSSE